MHPSIRQAWLGLKSHKIIRYLFSGGISAVVDILLFNVLIQYYLKADLISFWGVGIKSYSFALTISYTCGSVTSFFMNKYFVFGAQNQGMKQFLKSLPVYVFAFFGNWILLKFFIEGFHTPAFLSRVIAAVLVAFLTFNLHKYFTFKNRVLSS